MAHIRRILQHFGAFVMSVILTLLPSAGIVLPTIETKYDDCLLNVPMLSDTHIEYWEPFRQGFLRCGLRNLRASRSRIDAVLLDGDLTNYGDVQSMDSVYAICEKYRVADTMLLVNGNHDIGHVEDRDHNDVRADLIARYNAFAGTQYDKIYYSTVVNGYTFVVLCDKGDRWDYCKISETQLAFLDAELARGTADGKPVFVCCHWPIEGTHSEDVVWPDSGLDLEGQDVQAVLEKYKNVFYISGHMHAGIKSRAVEERYGLSSAEQKNGVTYLNLPTYGLVNWFGYPWSGTGAHLEVYADKVLFRPRSFLTGHWFVNSEYTFELI